MQGQSKQAILFTVYNIKNLSGYEYLIYVEDEAHSTACCPCSTAGGRESGLMTTDMQATPTRELAQATLVGGRDPSLPSARGRAT